MSFSNETVMATYAGNGSTTSFSITQTILSNSQVVVYLKDSGGAYTLQTLTTHYTFTGSPATAVVFVTAPASGVTVVIVRSSGLAQATDYLNTGPFLAETHEAALDKIVMQLQELNSKSLKKLEYDTTASVLPVPVASQVLGTDASGNWVWYAPTVAGVIAGVLPIANGGTNSTATPTAGGIGYGTGTANAYSSAGTSGQIVQSNGASAPTFSTATYPSTVAANKLLYGSSTNVVGALDYASGSYTPTITNGTNIAASTARLCQYLRIGSRVVIVGTFDADVTAAGNSSTLELSLPIASNFTLSQDCSGTLTSGVALNRGIVQAQIANDRLEIFLNNVSSTVNESYYFSAMYEVK